MHMKDLFFSNLTNQPIKEHIFLIFEQFKGLGVCLLTLYTISSDPMKKGPHKETRRTKQEGVTDKLSVQSPVTLP